MQTDPKNIRNFSISAPQISRLKLQDSSANFIRIVKIGIKWHSK